MPARYGMWKLASLYIGHRQIKDGKMECIPYHLEEKKHSAVIHFHYWLPTTPEAFCDLSYEVFGTGKIAVTLQYDPVAGLPDLPEFGMIFTMPPVYNHVTWYGLGPADTYQDRMMGGKMDLYHNLVENNMAPYLVPQECGNKEHVHFASVTNARGEGFLFEAYNPKGFSFSALPYTPHQLEQAAHTYELPRPVHTVIRVAMEQMGIGGDDSWGAKTHAEYLLPCHEKMIFRFSFRGI